MEFWKKMSTNEKVMVVIIATLILMITLSWGRISKGVQDGIAPYLKEQTQPNQ